MSDAAAPHDVIASFPIARIDRDRHEVWSYACTEEPGLNDRLVLGFDSSVKAFTRWPGNVREAHSQKAVGRCLEWRPDHDKRMIWVGARIVDPTTWEKVDQGVLRAFSVKGPVLATETRMLERNGRTIPVQYVTDWEMEELSLVDRPGDAGVPKDFVQIIRNGAITDVVAEGSLADADPLACSDVIDPGSGVRLRDVEPGLNGFSVTDTSLSDKTIDRVTIGRAAPAHAPMVGNHSHGHAGYAMDDTDPTAPHNHLHEHGANGTADASHDHSHDGVHAVKRADGAAHDPFTGTHSHAHADPRDTAQATHDHSHSHDGDANHADHSHADLSRAGTPTQTVDGKAYPKSDFAYTPTDTPSDWKLRLTAEPGGAPDAAIVGAAAAALGAGFRGQKADIPAADRAAVVAKVRAAWAKANPDKKDTDMPDGIARAEQVLAIDTLITDANATLGRLYTMKRGLVQRDDDAAVEQTQVEQATQILTLLRQLMASEAGEDDTDTNGVQTLLCAVNDIQSFISGEMYEAVMARREEKELMTASEDIARALGLLAEGQAKQNELMATLVERAQTPEPVEPPAPAETLETEVQRAASAEAASLEVIRAELATNRTQMTAMQQLLERVAAQPASNGPILRTESVMPAERLFPGETATLNHDQRTAALADLAERTNDPKQRDAALNQLMRMQVAEATGAGASRYVTQPAMVADAGEAAPHLQRNGPDALPRHSGPR